MHQVPRKVEREPALAEEPCLEAVRVRCGDHEDSARRQQLGGASERVRRARQMLERVPEDDRGEVAPIELADVGGLDVWTRRDELEPDRLAPVAAQRIEEGAVT